MARRSNPRGSARRSSSWFQKLRSLYEPLPTPPRGRRSGARSSPAHAFRDGLSVPRRLPKRLDRTQRIASRRRVFAVHPQLLENEVIVDIGYKFEGVIPSTVRYRLPDQGRGGPETRSFSKAEDRRLCGPSKEKAGR